MARRHGLGVTGTYLLLRYTIVSGFCELLNGLLLRSRSIFEGSDLSGIDCLTNLEDLVVWGNDLTDITPLALLTQRTTLSILEDLSPLVGLTNLTKLYLNNNRISDLSPVSEMIHLTVLVLDANTFTDISALAKLDGLTALDLQGAGRGRKAGFRFQYKEMTCRHANVADKSHTVWCRVLSQIGSQNRRMLSPL